MSRLQGQLTWALLAALSLVAAAPRSLRAQDGAEDGGLKIGAQVDALATSDMDEADEAEAAEDAEAEGAEPGPVVEEPDAVTAVEQEAPPARGLAVHAGAGLGVGSLAFVRPTPAGRQKLPDTPFAAAEFTLRAHVAPDAALSLDVLLAYQTSVDFEIEALPLFGLPERLPVRAQRAELSAAPVLRLGEGSDVALAFPVGFAFRTFLTEVHHPRVADYVLGGPHARAEFWLRLGDHVNLRAGPEAQWLVLVDPSLRRAGACCQGFALGGQGAVEARVGPTLRLALAYREAHAFVPAGTYRFKDVERFLTVRAAGEL